MALYEDEELTETEKVGWIEQYEHEIKGYKKEITRLQERTIPFYEEIELLEKKLAVVREIIVKK